MSYQKKPLYEMNYQMTYREISTEPKISRIMSLEKRLMLNYSIGLNFNIAQA